MRSILPKISMDARLDANKIWVGFCHSLTLFAFNYGVCELVLPARRLEAVDYQLSDAVDNAIWGFNDA